MINKYLAKNKHSIWPWIKDWTDPQDHLRNEKDVGKLNHMQWFFFHPTAYNLINTGAHFVGAKIFMLAALFCLYKDYKLAMIFCTIIMIASYWQFYKKWKKRDETKNTTFYDMWLREYKGDQVK